MNLLTKSLVVGATMGIAMAAQASQVRTVRCESIGHHYKECYVGGEVLDAYMVQQLSSSDCREGRSWGADWRRGGDYLWVDEGCRGIFRVRVQDGHWNNSEE